MVRGRVAAATAIRMASGSGQYGDKSRRTERSGPRNAPIVKLSPAGRPFGLNLYRGRRCLDLRFLGVGGSLRCGRTAISVVVPEARR